MSELPSVKVTAMQGQHDKSEIVQTLQCLMERLSAPDLTAAEANNLRPRLLGLLESKRGSVSPLAGSDRAAGSDC
jgi:hypothetical protein